MYVRTYVRMYVRPYVRMYVCIYVCMYLCMYVCNSLSTVQTSEDIHSFNVTDLFHVAKYGHTDQAI